MNRCDVTPGGFDVVRSCGEAGSHGVCMYRRSGPVRYRLAGEGRKFVWDGACPHQLESLGHAYVAGVGLADPITDRSGFLYAYGGVIEFTT